MNAELPIELEQAIAQTLTPYGTTRLRSAVERLSERYRSASKINDRFVDDDLDAAAYVAYRMPATYAALSSVFRQMRQRMPAWHPTTMLDVGAGTGAGLWAATSSWEDAIDARLLDRSEPMIALGRQLSDNTDDPRVRDARWLRRDISEAGSGDSPSLVLSSYVLNEQPVAALTEIVHHLWSITGEMLVVLEPGTPAGFETIRNVRELLIGASASVLAPCPHDRTCPMPHDDWCHFSVRLPRTRIHREVKPGELGYEDEKFSYVVASKLPIEHASGRILRHPTYRRGMAQLVICGQDGISSRTVTRGKDRQLFRYARQADWGDEFPDA